MKNCDNCVAKCFRGVEVRGLVMSATIPCQDYAPFSYDWSEGRLHHMEYCPVCGTPMRVYQICDNELYYRCTGDGMAIECENEGRMSHNRYHILNPVDTWVNVYMPERTWTEAEGGYYLVRTVCVDSYQVNFLAREDDLLRELVDMHCDLERAKERRNSDGNREVYDGEVRIVVEDWRGLDSPVPYYC